MGPMSIRALASLMFCVVALAPASLVAGETVRLEREVTEEHSPEGIERVRIEQLAGPVRVTAGDSDRIRVRAVVHAAGEDESTAGKIRDKGGIELDEDGDRLRIRPRLPLEEYRTYYYEPPGREGGGFNRTSEFAGESLTVQSRTRWGRGIALHHAIEVELPADMGLDLNQQVGPVSVSDLDGPVRLRMRGESAELSRLGGRLDIDTGGGRLELTGHQGEAQITTGSGSMHLAHLRDGPYRLKSGSGAIRVDAGAGEFRVETGSGGFRATEFVAGQQLRLKSGSGGIMLEGDLSALRDARIETSSADIFLQTVAVPSAELRINNIRGGIEVDLPEMEQTRRQRNRFEAILGEGEGRIELESRLGEIRFVTSPAGAVEGGLFD